MIYYSMFFLLTLAYLFLAKAYHSKIFIYVVLLFALFFSSFRYNAGSDYFSYLDIINTNYRDVEISNLILMDISNFFNFPQFYFISTSFIYIISIIFALKKINALNYLTIFLFLFFLMSYITSFDIIRQMVATSLLFLSFSYLLNKKNYKSFFLILLAISFHKSAIIFIVAILYYYLFARKEFKLYIYIFLPLIFFLFFDKIVYFISKNLNLYYHYFDVAVSNVGYKSFVIILIFYLILIFFAKIYSVKERLFWIFFNMFFLVILLQSALLLYGYHLYRVSYLFGPFVYPSVWFLYREIPKNIKSIFLIIVFSVCLLTYFGLIYVGEDSLKGYQFYFLVED